MNWYQLKEKSAGSKRLILTWRLYKFFGKNMLYFIAYLISFFTFLFSKDLRKYSRKYLKIVKIKPDLFNIYKHISSYAISLADKMLAISGNFDVKNIVFENIEDKKEFYQDIENKKGIVLICSHIGNIEVLQALLIKKPDFRVNIFLSNKQSTIFRDFLNSIKVDFDLNIFSTDNIGIETALTLKENLDRGDICFIAGDRTSENDTKTIEEALFNHKIKLPKGTFKLAKLMETPIYFITAIKFKDDYKIFLEKQKENDEKILARNFAKNMEKMILVKPYQFFHFYDFFE